jgi:hypothetical protein
MHSLTSVDVRLTTVDHSAPYLYPTRALEIKTRKGFILTPTRASTSYEYRQKGRVPSAIPIDSELSVDVVKLNYKNLQYLINTNDYLVKLHRKIDLSSRLAQYSQIKVGLLQPTSSATIDPKTKTIKYPSGMSLLKDPGQLDKFLRIIINLQALTDLDLITIPALDLPLSVLKKVYSDIDRSIEKINRQPLFVIDMKYHNPAAFSEIIDFLIKDLHANVIGLVFRDYVKTPQSYETISKYSDENIAFLSMQVERSDAKTNLSTMHCLPFMGGDLYSVAIPGPFIPNESKPKATNVHRLNGIKLFNTQSLELNQISLYPQLEFKVKNQYSGDPIIKEMIDNYLEAETDDKKYTMLNAFSRVDELKSSFTEFSNLQKFIKQDSAKDYVSEKETLRKALKLLKRPSFG